MKKIFILMFVMILLVGTVSAFEFDNKLTYSKNDMKVNLTNWFGLGTDYGSAELKSHKSVTEIKTFGFGKEEIVTYYDFDFRELYINGLGDVEFIDMKTNKTIQKDYSFVEWVVENVEVNDYQEVCGLSINGTSECSSVISGTYLEERGKWIKYNGKDIPKGNTRIGLKTYVGRGDWIDGIWTIAGKKVKKHITWAGDLNDGLIAYYDFEETSGDLLDSTGSFNASSNGWTRGETGIIGNAYNATGTSSSEVNITSSETDRTINVWLNQPGIPSANQAILFDSQSPRWFIHTEKATTGNLGFYDGQQSNWGVSQIRGSWNMYTFIFNSNTTATLYINGVVSASLNEYNPQALGTWTTLGWSTSKDANAGMVGLIDEFGMWNRTITQEEITYLYNNGDGCPFGDDSCGVVVPTITLDSPANNTNFTLTNNVIMNATIFDNTNITNVTLYLDNMGNETNLTSGLNNTVWTFNKTMGEGDFFWTFEACNFNNKCINASQRTFNINTTPNIQYGIGVPVNEANITNNFFEVNVTLTEDLFKNITFDLYVANGILNQSVTFTNASREKVWTNLPDATYSYNVTVATVTNQFNSTATRNISIDSNNPVLEILAPPTTISFHAINTNLFVNWSINDTNLDTCILEYEDSNTTLTCSDNTTSINITTILNRTITLYANDTFGNVNSTSRSWNYTIFENSQTFNDLVFEGNLETFTANITLGDSLTISTTSLFYNGNSNTGSSSSSGNDSILTTDLIIPSVATDTNITFIWNVQLSDGQSINITPRNQTIIEINLDDCSSNTIVLYNYTMVDEGNQTELSDTTMEINLNLLDVRRQNFISNFTNISIGINPFAVCLNQEINDTNYVVDSIIKYQANGYSIEYYNIVNSTITNLTIPINITLFDLALADTTEFRISFKGEDFVFVENALIFIDRLYISENNTFKTVELPKTDANGKTIGHFVRNDVIYNIIVVKDGEVLGTFNNIIAFCTDFTIGDCQIVLEATPSDLDFFNYDEELGIIFDSVATYDSDTNLISFSFTTDDGTPKTIRMEVTRKDIFGNRSICNSTLTSSSGTLSCSIDPNIDDTTLETNIYVNNQLAVLSNVVLDASTYGNLGFILWFFLTFIFIWVFGSSKTEVLIGLVLSFAGAISLGITRGSIVGIGSAGIWIMVIVLLGIWKLNKENLQ